MLTMEHVVAKIHSREISRQTCVIALGRRQGAITRVLGPANVEDHRVGAFAVFVDKIAVGPRSVGAQAGEFIVLETNPGEYAVVLGNGHTEIQAAPICSDLI